MSYVSNLQDTSYDHSDVPIDVRCRDLTVDGATNVSLPSARYNIPIDVVQLLEPTDPNPSYITFDALANQGLYEYSQPNEHWEVSDPQTILINTEGNYLISISLNVVSDIDPGTAVFQIFNLGFTGGVGGEPPICSSVVEFSLPPFVVPYSYVGTNCGVALAHLAAGSTIKLAYVVTESCSLTPTSNICICKV